MKLDYDGDVKVKFIVAFLVGSGALVRVLLLSIQRERISFTSSSRGGESPEMHGGAVSRRRALMENSCCTYSFSVVP